MVIQYGECGREATSHASDVVDRREYFVTIARPGQQEPLPNPNPDPIFVSTESEKDKKNQRKEYKNA